MDVFRTWRCVAGASPARYTQCGPHSMERRDGDVIDEVPRVLYVNKQQIVTFMCTPVDVHHLALGFLVSEGIVSDPDDVLMIRVYEDGRHCHWYVPALGLNETRTMRVDPVLIGTIDARVATAAPEPGPRVLTSGCGGGVTFDDLSGGYDRLNSSLQLDLQQIFGLMRQLHASATLYRHCRGVHTSALSDGERLLAVAADVGRHNTLDKLRGDCVVRGIDTTHRILLTTGRISSEMLTKAIKMRVPVVMSRTAPTSMSIRLARQWGITLVGYVRHQQCNVYTGHERIRTPAATDHGAEALPGAAHAISWPP
jgi:FdhD protein